MKRMNVYRKDEGTRSYYYFADGENKDRKAFSFKHETFKEVHKDNAAFGIDGSEQWFHLTSFRIVDDPDPPKPKNVAIIKSECGQSTEMRLQIDENQSISEVTVRGVKYVPA